MNAYMVKDKNGRLDMYFINPQKKWLKKMLEDYYEASWESIKKYWWTITKVYIEMPILIPAWKLPKSVQKKYEESLGTKKERFNI